MAAGDPEQPASSRRSTRSLVDLLRRTVRLAWEAAPRTVTASFAAQVASAVGVMAQLLIGRWLLSELLGAGDAGFELRRLAPAVLALVAATSVMGLLAVVQSTLSLVIVESVARRAAGQVLDVASNVEPVEFERPEFHDKLERARFSAGARPAMAVNGLVGLTGAVVASVGITAAIMVIDPLLVPLALVGAVPAWIASTINSRGYHRFVRRQTTDDRRRSYLLHVLSNRDLVKEVRVYGMAGELRRRHDALYDERLRQVRVLARARRRIALAAAAGGALAMLTSLGYLLWAVDRGRIDLASAGTALFALLFLAQRLRGMVSHAGTLYEAALFINDVEEFRRLRHPARPADTARTDTLPPFEVLRAEGLCYTYPGSGAPALRGVDLELRRGEAVALVGENGSGKTTLAKLLIGIYRPTAGTLRWDGIDLMTIDPERLRRSVSVVFQDYARFHLTALDNIGLGDPSRMWDRAGIEQAAVRAAADEVVGALPGRWEQLLSRLFPGGVDLSGGQWQRLALARALFRAAPLLVMDEPSSALDARAEARLFERIRDVADDRTLLFISHRFSTVRLADRIYVLHDGRVVEEGSHDQLLERRGHYAELYWLQASAFGQSPSAAGPPGSV